MQEERELRKELILNTLRINGGEMFSTELYPVFIPFKMSRGKFLQYLSELKYAKKITYNSFFWHEEHFLIRLLPEKEASQNVS